MSVLRSSNTPVRLIVQTPLGHPGSPPGILKVIVFASGRELAALIASRKLQCAATQAPKSKSSVVLTTSAWFAGTGSSFVIVSVVGFGEPSVAPLVGADKVRLTVSLASYVRSPFTVTRKVLSAVSPSAQLTSPDDST